MRPTELSVQGLTAFREPQTVELAELDLFAITGPTGSGKTTLLDALSLALYGKVPRAKKGELKELISHGSSDARVGLVFDADGETYRATRRLRRTGAAEAAFERRDGDGWTPVCDGSGVRLIDAAIEQVIGLDFDAFTKAVVLPQGEFAEFLRGDAAERRSVLVRLLDLERYTRAAQIAGRRASELRMKIELAEQLLASEFADATDERRAELEALAHEQRRRANLLDAGARRIIDAASRVAGELEQVSRLTALAARTATLAHSAREHAVEATAATTAHGQSLREVDAAGRVHTEAAAAADMARKALEEVVASGGDEQAIAELRIAHDDVTRCRVSAAELREQQRAHEPVLAVSFDERLAAASELERARAELASVTDSRDAARAALTRATTVADEARARSQAGSELAAAERRLGDARSASEAAGRVAAALGEAHATAKAAVETLERADVATVLRVAVVPGETCPVCDHLVTIAPTVDHDVKAHLEAAEGEEARAAQALRAGERDATREKTLVEQLQQRCGELTDGVAALGEGPSVEAAEGDLARAKTETAAAEGAVSSADAVERVAERAAVDADHRAVAAEHERDRLQREIDAATARRGVAEARLASTFPGGLPENLEAEIALRDSRLRAVRAESNERSRLAAEARKGFDRAQGVARSTEVRLRELELSTVKTVERASAIAAEANELVLEGALAELATDDGEQRVAANEVATWLASAAEVLAREGSHRKAASSTAAASVRSDAVSLVGEGAPADLSRLPKWLDGHVRSADRLHPRPSAIWTCSSSASIGGASTRRRSRRSVASGTTTSGWRSTCGPIASCSSSSTRAWRSSPLVRATS